jgi:hypothetical protein
MAGSDLDDVEVLYATGKFEQEQEKLLIEFKIGGNFSVAKNRGTRPHFVVDPRNGRKLVVCGRLALHMR